MLIRPYEPRDAEGATAVFREGLPAWVFTPASVQHWVDSQPERARLLMLVAEEDGRVVGAAETFLIYASSREGGAVVWAGVLEQARGRGIGGRLFDQASEHIVAAGAQRIVASTDEKPEGEQFLVKRGFAETRKERISAVDPSAVDLSRFEELRARRESEGYRLVRLAELIDRPHDLYELHAQAGADAPSDHPWDRVEYEEWRRQSLEDPDLTLEGSFVVLEGDRPVSLAWLQVDPESRRAANAFTGTLRSHRRRGLGRLAKLATLAWAREAGIREIVTGNDSTNADMLALNDHLGYRPLYWWREFARDVG